MKQPRKLTRAEKENVSAYGYNANDYMYVGEVSESYYKVIHKQTKKIVIIDKFRKKRK